MKNLEIINRDFDLENGFFWVEFEGGNVLQCCLKGIYDENGLFQGFLEQVSAVDNGYSDGLCWDANEWAVSEDGEHGHIQDFLVEQAREIGLEIVAE